jgi:hypothetical protein
MKTNEITVGELKTKLVVATIVNTLPETVSKNAKSGENCHIEKMVDYTRWPRKVIQGAFDYISNPKNRATVEKWLEGYSTKAQLEKFRSFAVDNNLVSTGNQSLEFSLPELGAVVKTLLPYFYSKGLITLKHIENIVSKVPATISAIDELQVIAPAVCRSMTSFVTNKERKASFFNVTKKATLAAETV